MEKKYSIDLLGIREKIKVKSVENEDFKSLLKRLPSKEIDQKVFEIAAEVSANIDCLACANCCKNLEPELKKEEIAHLAQLKGMETADFVDEFVFSDEFEDIDFLKQKPCIFLENKSCTIYEKRPFSCADYPHLYKPHFKYRLKSIFRNYPLCPIVFHTIEQLKEDLNTHTLKNG